MENNKEEGLKFVSAQIRYFKNITSRVIDINGMSLLVMGRNSAGKSSFIQALTAAIDTKTRPSEPITIGKPEDEISSVEVAIGGVMGGEPKKYILKVHFTPGNKKGTLTVFKENGEEVKPPATFLKGLIGEISVDPTQWLNDSKDKKLQKVKQLTGCELEIDKINSAIKDKKAVKKSKKDQATEMENVLKHHGYSKAEIDKYSNPIDIGGIQLELTNISKNIEVYSGVEAQMKGFKKAIEDSEKKISDYKEEIEHLKKQIQYAEEKIDKEFSEIEKNKSNLVKGDEWLNKKQKPSVDEINTRLEEANKHNIHHAKIAKHAEQQKLMIRAKEEVNAIDVEIDGLENKRSDLISKSQLPIPGFSFDDNDIYIDGLPMVEGQINTARLFDVAVDVALAMKPKLRVVFLHEASLFDSENLKAIIQKIEAKNCMAIAEIVTSNDLEIKFAEEEMD